MTRKLNIVATTALTDRTGGEKKPTQVQRKFLRPEGIIVHSDVTLPIVVKQIHQALDCSPANRERGSGLNRHETGTFYPTDDVLLQ